jgi:hypothetical protein
MRHSANITITFAAILQVVQRSLPGRGLDVYCLIVLRNLNFHLLRGGRSVH